MSTGAILARGGCRALKWVALFGAVLALGIGTASAQPVGVTVTGPSGNMVNEGDNATYTVTVTGYVPANTATSTDVVVTLATPAPGSTAATAGEAGDLTTNRGLIATITAPVNSSTTSGRLFSGSATVIIGTTHDLDAEDEEFTIAAPDLTTNHLETTAAGGTDLTDPTTGFPTALTIKDDETQSYDLTLDAGQTPDEGEAINLTLTANPAHEDGEGVVSVYLDVQPTIATIAAGGETATLSRTNRDDPVVIMPVANDKNRSTDTIVVSAYTSVPGSPTPRLVSELSIEVKDDHVLPGADAVTVKGIWDKETGGAKVESVTEGGDAVYVEFEVDRGTGGTTEALELELAVNPSREAASYRFNDEVTFPSGSGKQTRRLELRALSDEFVNDAMLTLSFELTGEAGNGTNETDAAKNSTSGMLAPITVVNGTTTQIEAKPEAELTTAVDAAIAAGAGEDGVNPGESFSVKVADLFAKAPAGATFAATSSGPAVDLATTGGSTVAGGTLIVTASSVGEATVTVTGNLNPASSARPLPQVNSTTAQVEFDVTVVNEPLSPLSVKVVADPMEIMEGEKSTITATANRAVAEATTIALSVIGDAELNAESITILANSDFGSVVLTATEDDDDMDETVNVVASGPGIDGNTTINITVTDNDAAAMSPIRAKAGAAGTIASAIATVAGDSPWMAGGMAATVDMSLLFDLDEGVTATYEGVSSDDDVVRAISSGKTLTLTPMGGGEATITVTGTVGDVEVEVTHDATVAPTGPTGSGNRGQITKLELIGGDVSEKTIGGVKRYHVPEGAQNVKLAATVQWTHEEIAAIGYDTRQTINVEIKSDRGARLLPNWLSWIDDEGDVDFPNTTGSPLGRLTGVVIVRTPKLAEVPTFRGSPRHVKSKTGELALLVLHDNHEAENDAFYIEAVGSDHVDLNATAAVNRITPVVVIEDDEDQVVTVSGPSKVYEGDSGGNAPVLTVTAKPERIDLPLEVRLDMIDLSGVTVSSAEISLSTSAMTLQDGTTGNSDTVTIHLPATDGNREDDDYQMQASVNVYSLASGGYRTIPVETHDIEVLDRHKLPVLTVSPATKTVEEGDEIELTLTINRNPHNTPVSSTEKLQYTQEAVTVALTMGAGSSAAVNDDFLLPAPVTFPKRERGSYTAEMKVEVTARADNELDDMEVLVLDAMVAGTVAANGSDKDVYAGVSSLTIEEGTERLVWAKTQEEVQSAIQAARERGMGSDMTFSTGEMIEIMGSALFNSAQGITLDYLAKTSDGNVASTVTDGGGRVVVTAVNAGIADITITAHATSSGATIPDQTAPDEASIMFPVEVGLVALSLTLEGPANVNLAEGDPPATVTVRANRAVTKDVMVTLMRDRSKSTAGDDDFTAGSITIDAGEMTGSTMVRAVEDNLMETVDNMAEELVLYGMAADNVGEVSGEVRFLLWDASVPALPIIAQLLLAAFLGVGGYRRYRRR